MKTVHPLRLPAFLQRLLEAKIVALLQPEERPRIDFSVPPGEPALTAADSVSWQVFKNPVVLFIGGVTAALLELAEPRVRTGVWEHTTFRTDPLSRMQRTGLATMTTVYGPRSHAVAAIAAVTARHRQIAGTTPGGAAYSAVDCDLLDWVHATASFGFLEAYHAYVRRVGGAERDRFYREGLPSARAYGATATPHSQADLDAQFESMRGRLEASPIVFEFLAILRRAPVWPKPLRPMQGLLIKAAVETTPAWVRERLGLDRRWLLRPWQRWLVRRVAATADRLVLRSTPPVQACRRLGLPDDYLVTRDGR